MNRPSLGRDPIIRIENLSYQYPHAPNLVLRNINLTVQQGEFLGIIGPTGAGKTTLCLALNGIVPQFHGGRFFGRASVAGLDTVDHPIAQLAQQVAIVFQDPETQLIANSVEDEIAFGLENQRVPRQEMRERIGRALETVRLSGMEKRHPAELSGGEKQRLAIAAALALRPAVMVLDEPTSQLDPLGTREVFATIADLRARLGITVILASQASEELAEFADRIALLAQGELVDVGVPARVLAQEDLLAKYAVRPPQVTSFYLQLSRKGLHPPSVPITLEGAERAYEALRPKIALDTTALPQTVHQPASIPALLSAQRVEHSYPDGTRALQGISLDVAAGEYVAIVGQNGAGKTTLLKQFLHLLEPATGLVFVKGQDVRELAVSDLAQRIGFVSQNPDHQIFNTTVEAEVAFALPNLGLRGRELRERVEESLNSMGLSDLRARHPLSLAKGDRARVVIAAALATRPDVLVLDEPTTGQDYGGAKRILDLSHQLHQAGKTVIVVTHHLYLMPGYAQRVVVMGRGTVLLDAPIRVAFHETTLLESTYLAPPQIVQFAQHIASREKVTLPILTEQELVACFKAREVGA